MKTKITFLSVAIAAILGVGMLMAFKKEEDNHKKYLILNLSYQVFNRYKVVQIDENGILTEETISGKDNLVKNYITVESDLFNKLSLKGYRLIGLKGDSYYFEK